MIEWRTHKLKLYLNPIKLHILNFKLIHALLKTNNCQYPRTLRKKKSPLKHTR